MNPTKSTYASVLKNSSPTLDPKATAKPLIAKPIRARLSKEAKANLRAAIRGEETMIVDDPIHNPVVYVEEPAQPSNTYRVQPLTLASASAGILPSVT